MAMKKRSSGKKRGSRRGGTRAGAGRRSGAKRARKAARRKPAARKSARRPAKKAARKQSPVARAKRVARAVVEQATVAVTSGVDTLREVSGNLVDRVRDQY